MGRNELDACRDRFSNFPKFQDYCPNRLWVEERAEDRCLLRGVTAAIDFINAASGAGPEAALVQHRYFETAMACACPASGAIDLRSFLLADINLRVFHRFADVRPEFNNYFRQLPLPE